jgi:hypothetical protein
MQISTQIQQQQPPPTNDIVKIKANDTFPMLDVSPFFTVVDGAGVGLNVGADDVKEISIKLEYVTPVSANKSLNKLHVPREFLLIAAV